MDRIYYSADGFGDEHIFHGFFGRKGGVSGGIYESLNCGRGTDDDLELVERNRAIVAEQAGCGAEKLLSLYQVHSDRCVAVSSLEDVDPRPQGDAFVTDQPGLALGILTADCTPVLFYGRKGDGSPVVAAAHAGWGGALKGVMNSTIEEMARLGAEVDTLRAAIGPCIAQKSYEVGLEFAEKFLAENDENERFFMTGQKEGHLMFDLPGYCAVKLAKAGIKHVTMMDMDTYAQEEAFFSYRRKTHRGEPDYGRQISVIMIKS